MASLTFLQNRNFTLSTDSLVYEPEEVNTLQSILDQAGEIHRLLENEKSLIDQARQKAHEEGYEAGQSAGYEAALEHIATKLVTLAKDANAAREELRDSSADIAIKIVDRIAAEIGTRETVKSLALTAAKQLTTTESIVLRVHPDNKDYLVEQLLQESPHSQKFVDVLADAELSEQDCVLETEYGHIKAGLQTQLKVMREQLYDR